MQAYVSYQKASGHWNEASYEPNLVLFDRYCKKQYPQAEEKTGMDFESIVPEVDYEESDE